MRTSPRRESRLELEALIENLCDRYLERLLRARAAQLEASSPKVAIPDPAAVAAFAAEETTRMAAGDRSVVEADARKLLAESGTALCDADFDELCYGLQRTLIRGFLESHQS